MVHSVQEFVGLAALEAKRSEPEAIEVQGVIILAFRNMASKAAPVPTTEKGPR